MLLSRLGVVALAAAILSSLLVGTAPARATAVAIFYSAQGNGYGWCTRGSLNDARDCARQQCADSGNADCQLALECSPAGWGAIARVDETVRAFGASCGMTDLATAREFALLTCAAAAHDYCWLEYAFSYSRTIDTSTVADKFGIAYYAQVMLNLLKRDVGVPDGVLGPHSRDEIRKFQTDLGMAPTGELDNELFYRLEDGVGGGANFARIVQRDMLQPHADIIANGTYSTAPEPASDAPVAKAMGMLSEKDRLMRLATILSSRGHKCKLPALSASVGLEDNQWDVKCEEGGYAIIFGADTWHFGTVLPMGDQSKPQSDSDLQPDTRKHSEGLKN